MDRSESQPQQSPSSSHEGGYVFTREASRVLDHAAIHEFGIPGMVLMENAARGLANVVHEQLVGLSAEHVLIVCGKGNNGGDGFAAARHLANFGYDVRIATVCEMASLKGDALTNAGIVEKMRIPVRVLRSDDHDGLVEELDKLSAEPMVVVDALFGTGACEQISGQAGALIGAINTVSDRLGNSCVVVAADVPSGLDADEGEPLALAGDQRGRTAVRASVTVTFVGYKQGFLSLTAQPYVGRVVVVDIGAPAALIDRFGREFDSDSRPGDDATGVATPRPAAASLRPGT